MAIDGLKSAGVAAYQGSSPKPAVKTVEAAVKLEPPVAMAKSVKVPEKTVEMAQKKPEIKTVDTMADGNSKVQDKPAVNESVKMPEPVNTESKESAEKLPTEALKRAVEEINKNVVNSEAVFGVHDSTNRVTIKIVDKKTKEVLKEYPPEKTLDMIAKVWELAGLLVDEKR